MLLCLPLLAQAKAPQNNPSPHFAIRVPSDWSSPNPDQWASSDGSISLVWKEVSYSGDMDNWVRAAQKNFPGTLIGQVQSLTVASGPARSFMGEHQGRIQRVLLVGRNHRGVVLVCSHLPSQSFAAAGEFQKIWSSFRWIP